MSIVIISQTIKDKSSIQSFMKEFKDFVVQNLDDDFNFILNSNFNSNDHNVYELNSRKTFNRLFKLFDLFKHIYFINNKKNITKIYVHQLSIFVIVLFPLRFLGIKIYLWRAHTKENFTSILSYFLASKIFTTNRITAKYFHIIKHKYFYIGQMINTKKFFLKKNKKNFNYNLIYIGRVTKVKNLHEIIEYISKFNQRNKYKLNLDIYGPKTYVKEDYAYYKYLIDLINKYNIANFIKFKNAIKREKIKDISKKYFFNINFSNGAIDKSVLELIMLNTIPLVRNKAFNYSFSDIYDDIESYQSFENRIITFSQMNNNEVKRLIELFKIKIELEHSLHNNIYKTFLFS